MDEHKFLTILAVLAQEIELLKYENARLKDALEVMKHEQ